MSSESAVTAFRARLTAGSLLLVGLALVQSPGLLVPDTKLDLSASPVRFLARALHLWDPQAALGQLQNQAYGYLWPMGPFFALGHALDVPGWVTQRLWLGLVLCVAFIGAALVVRAFGVRSDLATLLAATAFALSPRMLTTLGPISIEAWPSALAPWVLLPLVLGSRRGSAPRAAALSALAVAMVGGVNAAATFAVLPLGILWVLTRRAGPRRRSLLMWWPLFTLLGTAWWLVPLFLLGAHSPPFLDFIESASNTTFPTTIFDALRGTSDWVPYVDAASRAGNDLLRLAFLPLNSGLVLALGAAGLMRRRCPERVFLVAGVVVGLLLVTMGHLGSVQGWFAPSVHGLLDGALAPLRNVHKFDPVVRLPLVVGLGLAVDALLERRRARRGAARLNASVLVGIAILAVAASSTPALTARITPAGGLSAVPDYWSRAAGWLGDRHATALLVPGSSFGRYVWGTPGDEPMQWLARSRWAVRNSIPLAPAGDVRMLDAVEQRLSQGQGSVGLARYLRRAGFTHLVLRNDLRPASDIASSVLVHQALESSPGITEVAHFGPQVGGEAHLAGRVGRILVNGGWQNDYPAVQVYSVAGPREHAVDSAAAPVVVGGPEDLLDLTDLGLLHFRPTVLATDAGGRRDPAAPLVLTDGLRATERNYGRLHESTSATLSPQDPRRLGNPALDYLPAGAARWQTTARVGGVRSLRASSSMSDPNAFGGARPSSLPFAALDGRPETSWRSNRRVGQAQWWQVGLLRPTRLDHVTVSTETGEDQVIRVRTSHAVTDRIRIPGGAVRRIAVDDPDARRVRVEDVSGRPAHQLSLADVRVPGVRAHRSLVLPRLPLAWGDPDLVVLRAVSDPRTGCAVVDGATRCVAGRAVQSEEPLGFRRVVALTARKRYPAAVLRVRPRPGQALDDLVLLGRTADISASSTGDPDSRASAVAAVDGDRGTTWTADLGDLRPTLRLRWLGRHQVRGLRMSVPADTAARLPNEVTVSWPGGRRTGRVDRHGRVRLPAFRTDRLTIRIEEADPATSLGFDTSSDPVPVGIGELRVLGVPDFPQSLDGPPQRYGCGSGPAVTVNGEVRPSAVTASARDLVDGGTLVAEICGSPVTSLVAGRNVVEVNAARAFVPASLVLSGGDPVGTASRVAAEAAPSPVRRVVGVPEPTSPAPHDDLLVVRENANTGWRARLPDGRRLQPVVVDGWQQGWRLPRGARAADIAFGPDRTYRIGLLVGAVALVVLLGVCLVPGRRWPGHDAPPLRRWQPRGPVRLVLALLAACLLAGWWGLLAAAVGVVAVSVLERRRVRHVGPWVLSGLLAVAALAYVVHPWGDPVRWAGTQAWPHYLVVLVVSAAVVAWSPGRRRGRPTSRSRIAGRSTRWWSTSAATRLLATVSTQMASPWPVKRWKPVTAITRLISGRWTQKTQ